MPDPLARQSSPPPGTLWSQTSRIAGAAAAVTTDQRRNQILDLLSRGDQTLFELAEKLGCPDHTISGRITELKADGLIEPTGQTRDKPESGCPCAVYRLRPKPDSALCTLTSDLYPPTLSIPGDGLYDQTPEAAGDHTQPGRPYKRQGGLAQLIRVAPLLCPGCLHPLRLILDSRTSPPTKSFQCCQRPCNRTWSLVIASSPGAPPILILIQKTS